MNEIFRQSFKPYLIGISRPIGLIMLLLLLNSIFLENKEPEKILSDLIALVRIFSVVLGFILLLFFILVRFWVFGISPDNLTSYTYFGFKQNVTWSSINTVELTNYYGLPFLKISSTEIKSKLWLPILLNNRMQFIELVVKYAGTNNPLSEWLIKDGENIGKSRSKSRKNGIK